MNESGNQLQLLSKPNNLNTNNVLDNDLSKPPEIETKPNPNFYWGTEEFSLENGDLYSGDYCCHKSGIIWREGNGIYSSHDGHVYEGIWENDQLLNSPETRISYPSNDLYIGSILKGKYSGTGTYIFNNQLTIKSEFEENKPTGEVTLIDYEGYLWKGIAEENYALLLGVNQFFDALPDWRGVGMKISPKENIISIKSETKVLETPEDLEKLYFKKSSKTKNDFFEAKNTNFYCSKNCTNIACLTNPHSSDKLKIQQKTSDTVSLLKIFLSRSWREKSKPIPIIMPSCDLKTPEENKMEELNSNELDNISDSEIK